MEPDSKLDEYREVRAAVNRRVKEVMANAEQPGVVADVVLKAARVRLDRNSDTPRARSQTVCDCCADFEGARGVSEFRVEPHWQPSARRQPRRPAVPPSL